MSGSHDPSSITAGDDPVGDPAVAATTRARPSRHRWPAWVLVGLLMLAAAWAGRQAALASIGQLLVVEDPLEPVQVIVVSNANVVADALEVARLYHERYGAEVAVPAWEREPLAPAIRDLGIPYLNDGIALEILRRSGVPDTTLHVLQGTVDGTQTEVATVAAFARERQLTSLLFVTSRSHTARARWLLRRALPADTRLVVRAPRSDRFDAGRWWRSREDSREVVTEYLRWFNTVILRDPWGRRPPADIPR